MSRTQALLLALIVPVVLVAAYLVGSDRGDEAPSGAVVAPADDETSFEWDYIIPAGTADRIAAGDEIEIVPAELVVRVGDAIRIVNEDSADHVVGVFFVGAGETMTQRFENAAVLEGECSVHPSGAFTLRVVDESSDT